MVQCFLQPHKSLENGVKSPQAFCRRVQNSGDSAHQGLSRQNLHGQGQRSLPQASRTEMESESMTLQLTQPVADQFQPELSPPTAMPSYLKADLLADLSESPESPDPSPPSASRRCCQSARDLLGQLEALLPDICPRRSSHRLKQAHSST